MHKRLAIFGLTAGLVGGSVAGLTLAAPGLVGAETSSPTPSTSADATRPDPATRMRNALDPLVSAGTITQAQEDAVVNALQAARPERPFGPGFGRMGAELDTAARALGISAEELRTDLQNGQTIAQVAQARNIDPQTVIDALVADVKAKLDSRVSSGAITQDQADQRLADATDHITKLVNGQLPARPDHDGGPWGHSGGPGAPTAPSSTSPGSAGAASGAGV